MNCTIDPIIENSGVFCWLYHVANRGHAIEVALEVPQYMRYFSAPNFVPLQLAEAFNLVAVLIVAVLVLPLMSLVDPSMRPAGLRRSTRRVLIFFFLIWGIALANRTAVRIWQWVDANN